MADGSLADELASVVGGEVRADVPLAGYTTLRVGGPAAALVRAESPEDLAATAEVCAARGTPWLIIGRGSNLLVADHGFPGVAVLLGRAFRGLEFDGTAVVAGAAEPMPSLAQAVAHRDLGGLAFGVAIPGTVGGAVRMNAGAHGGEMRQVLEWAEVARLASGGRIERIGVDDLRMGYRRTALPSDAVVLRARLRLQAVDPERLRADMAEMRRWRREHQPINEPSCGSVFANPEGDSAGRLVELVGGKSVRHGRARVSEVHANFITVESGGLAADVYAVMREVHERVASACGIVLRTEVVLIGLPSLSAQGQA